MSSRLRQDYFNISGSPDLLVGISWMGGGRGKRIAQKSVAPSLFFELLIPHKNIRFVDLQYGDTKDQISQWSKAGLDVVHDNRVNPLKNMDLWLSQVNACDAVLSIANTTIHGSGGLNISTMCLLSVYSDWRWLIDPEVNTSYWYPSVSISRQEHNLDWSNAFTKVSNWFMNGCPNPNTAHPRLVLK